MQAPGEGARECSVSKNRLAIGHTGLDHRWKLGEEHAALGVGDGEIGIAGGRDLVRSAQSWGGRPGELREAGFYETVVKEGSPASDGCTRRPWAHSVVW